MAAARWIVAAGSAALAAACNVPIERFARPDAGAADDAGGGTTDDAMPVEPFVPLHVPAESLIADAPDLVLKADPTLDKPVAISTKGLTIDGQTSPYFVRVGDYAVLFTGKLTVEGEVAISGALPMIVIATGEIEVTARIGLGAVGGETGPGAATTGVGVGGPGQSVILPAPANVRVSSGGGGGGRGTLGGGGATCCIDKIDPGAHGGTFGSQPGDVLVGGAPGGAGGCPSTDCIGGGAGGGALQLSSLRSITIAATGAITAAGGHGKGGGGSANGGGGGGAGGEILLEAPTITVAGKLAANGGGGGGAGGNGGGGVPQGLDGEDGHDDATPAVGGAGGVPMGSPGGAGAAGVFGAFQEAANGSSMNSEGGGGGGGAGRIWLRYRTATPPNRTGATISPPAGLDDTL